MIGTVASRRGSRFYSRFFLPVSGRREEEIRNDVLDIRLYPILISIEMIFFVSVVFTGALQFFASLGCSSR